MRANVLIGLIALTALCACAEPSDEPTATPQTPTSSVPASPTTATTTEPTTTEPTTTPTPTPTSTPGQEKSLTAALLPADQLPPLTSSTPWRRAPLSIDTVSVCQRVSLPSIGATRIARRAYAVADTDAIASQVVAAFPDSLTAGYGFDILQAWLRSCGKRIVAAGYNRTDVPGSYTSLDVGDRAGWAVFFYGPVPGDANAAYIQAEALVVDGNHLSWVVQRSIGQDYNYGSGKSPPELAAPLMAARLSTLAASA